MAAHNPYEPPRAEVPAAAPAANGVRQLASLGKRFFGSVIDTLFDVPIAHGLSYAYAGITGQARTALVLQACMFVPFALQWWLITRRGQSVGKILLRTRVVMADGSLPGFVHGVALRVWPVLAATILPSLLPVTAGGGLQMLGLLVAIVDGLAIFSAGRRCIHDRMAGTYVVDVP